MTPDEMRQANSLWAVWMRLRLFLDELNDPASQIITAGFIQPPKRPGQEPYARTVVLEGSADLKQILRILVEQQMGNVGASLNKLGFKRPEGAVA